jgi:hypothetical protein
MVIVIRNGAKTRCPQNFVWGLNNNNKKKRCKNNKSPNFDSGLGIFKMAAVAMETVNVCQNL